MYNDEKKLIEKRKDIRVYLDYIVLERLNTQPYLMISELIDNSISSFDNEFGEKNWNDNVLKIEIKLNYYSREEDEIENIKYYPENYIEVKDNAFGIKGDKLIDSIILNKKLESNSTMNVHGKGLKQSSFYFGLGMKVTSKIPEDEEIFFVENNPVKHGFKKEVEFEVEEQRSNEYFTHNKSGTIIRIFNLRKNKKISKKKLEKILKSLSYRYGKMIKQGKLKILITLISPPSKKSNESSNVSFEVQEIVDDVAILKDEKEFSNSREKDNIEWEKRFDKELEKLEKSDNEKSNFENYPIVWKTAVEELKEILFSESKNIKLEWKQNIELDENNNEVEMKFWMLSKKSTSSSRGIRIFQGERALLHPPIIENESKTYLLRSVHETGSVDNRFAGEINIIGLDDIIKTTSDKATINFEDETIKTKFNNQVNMIYKIFEKFILIGRELERARGHMISTNDSATANKIKNMFSPFIKELTIPNDVDEEGNARKLDVKIELQKEYNIEVEIDNDSNPNELIYLKKYNEVNEEGINLTKGKIFFNHPIWKELREKTDKMTKDSILSFYIVLIIQELKWREKISKISEKNINCEKKLEEFKETSSPNISINEIAKGTK